MKISTILDHIDSGHMALPEFQRGYVWNSDQVRGLMDSLYKGHPVGGLLVWATESHDADHRGDSNLAPGVVKLLLDGQQRITSLYGIARGTQPPFFDGNPKAFTDLRFHLEEERFEFYQPVKMTDDFLWIDVTELMKAGHGGMGRLVNDLNARDEIDNNRIGNYTARLSNVLSILERDLHIEEVTGQDKTIDVVVDIFNRVNSGGTKLSKGDLALAKIGAEWPDARDEMKAVLKRWDDNGYSFSLDWLLRCMNTIMTGEALFQHLHDKTAAELKDGLNRAIKAIDRTLNMIAGRLGLDHDRVLFARFAVPVMTYYLDRRGGKLDTQERDKLLFWFTQAGMWGRFSGSTESMINKDLAVLNAIDAGPDQLLEQMRLWNGMLRIEPGHFTGWSLGARFYPVLYMLTRAREAQDWATGLPLKADLLGKNSSLEVHHIFPKAQLYKAGYSKSEVNAVANFCFLTKNANLAISDSLPENYFPEIERRHPGALASQWIPEDPELWRMDRYRDFLQARKELLAAEANRFFDELLHGDDHWLADPEQAPAANIPDAGSNIEDETDETILEQLNQWLAEIGLAKGQLNEEHADTQTGEPLVVLDMAWPDGLQEGLSQPVALLMDYDSETLVRANEAGYRCFTSAESLRRYVTNEIVSTEEEQA